MSEKMKAAVIVCVIMAGCAAAVHMMRKKAERTTYKADKIEPIAVRKKGVYEKYIKRIFDIVCGMGAVTCFSPLYLIIMIFVKIRLGSPVLFTQDRPGIIGEDGKETIFKMYKFRSMTDERDENGELLPDEMRLTSFGKWIRETSLDELGEAFNIINGTMSVIGPRPQLVRDLTFMTKDQRMRHTAKPGLSGLAQVNGRNSIKWEEKINLDLCYIQNISFLGDVKIIFETVKKALIRHEGITEENMATSEDLGDYLLRTKQVDQDEYIRRQALAEIMIAEKRRGVSQ